MKHFFPHLSLLIVSVLNDKSDTKKTRSLRTQKAVGLNPVHMVV